MSSTSGSEDEAEPARTESEAESSGNDRELNLAETEPAPAEVPSPRSLQAVIRSYQYDPEPGRDAIRGILAVGLLVLVALLAGAAFALSASDLLSGEQLDKLQPMFAALVTLTGTALGFYFGGKGK